MLRVFFCSVLRWLHWFCSSKFLTNPICAVCIPLHCIYHAWEWKPEKSEFTQCFYIYLFIWLINLIYIKRWVDIFFLFNCYKTKVQCDFINAQCSAFFMTPFFELFVAPFLLMLVLLPMLFLLSLLSFPTYGKTKFIQIPLQLWAKKV